MNGSSHKIEAENRLLREIRAAVADDLGFTPSTEVEVVEVDLDLDEEPCGHAYTPVCGECGSDVAAFRLDFTCEGCGAIVAFAYGCPGCLRVACPDCAGFDGLTRDEIGLRLGISQERVRQIEKHALRKLGRALGRADLHDQLHLEPRLLLQRRAGGAEPATSWTSLYPTELRRGPWCAVVLETGDAP